MTIRMLGRLAESVSGPKGRQGGAAARPGKYLKSRNERRRCNTVGTPVLRTSALVEGTRAVVAARCPDSRVLPQRRHRSASNDLMVSLMVESAMDRVMVWACTSLLPKAAVFSVSKAAPSDITSGCGSGRYVLARFLSCGSFPVGEHPIVHPGSPEEEQFVSVTTVTLLSGRSARTAAGRRHDWRCL
jgi:hypothetical protein